MYDTLDREADGGGSKSREPQVNRQRFRDTYEQVSTNGRMPIETKLTLSFTGDSQECDYLMNFFDARGGVIPFWFSFDKVEPERLYVTEGAYTKNHEGGLKYVVSVTFKHFGGLNVTK